MKALRLLLLSSLALVPVAAAQAPAVRAVSNAECSQTTTGLVPLTELGKRRYRGQAGGLYPANQNHPSRAYLAKGVAAAKRIHPLNGHVVLLSIGMANATAEFRALMRLAEGETDLNPNLVLVDGAMGGWDARRIAKPGAGYWKAVDRRLAASGVTAKEVQAVWLKTWINGEARVFPQDAKGLQTQLRAIVQILTRRFPNLKLIYPSSRIYGGYAITPVNPEPAAYDSAFAVKWLVQDRIANKFKAPWIGWGPYLWADGMKPRSDGLTWACEDFKDNGTQPSATGSIKVARLLLRFFKSDSTAKTWFLATS
jgi:hypothetical protein